MALKKTYIYKVYTNANVYIKTWAGPEVASELDYSQDINSPGTQVAVVLNRAADSFGEGTDIDLRNRVQIYVVDNDLPNGQLIFQGFISNYQPVYGNDERVEVTLLSFGAELDNYIIEQGESVYQSQLNSDSSDYIGTDSTVGVTPRHALAQTFQFTEQKTITAILVRGKMNLATFINPVSVYCRVYASDITAQSPFPTGSPVLSGELQTVTLSENDPSGYHDMKFILSTPIVVPANTVYSFAINAEPYPTNDVIVDFQITATGGYTSGDMLLATKSGGTERYAVQANKDLYFQIFTSAGNATSPFLSKDPGAMMRTIMDDYIAKGGTLSYTAGSIELTGTTVSYTFNTNTTLEGIKKCLELAPAGWYWYVDVATNLVHFHKKTSTVEHKFTLGKDITSLVPQRRIEDLVNTIYFTGAGTLFRKYTRTASVAAYGTKLLRYVDQRVSVNATADTIAQSILDTRSAPEARVEIEIADSNAQALGYDIESVTIGDIVSFRAVEAYDSNLWDVAQWDVALWDYNVKQLGTLILQIVRLEYLPGRLKLFLATTPPDVNKRIEDINRALTATQTVNNAATPTGVVI